ncbi:MAG: AMED_5909 family protein [Pseudonocardiaceae bacterium]
MMADDGTALKFSEVRTLKEAHDLAQRMQPKWDAPPSEWLAFRKRSVSLYTHVADVDRYHHHEAMYWVRREQELADELVTKICAEKSQQQRPLNARR